MAPFFSCTAHAFLAGHLFSQRIELFPKVTDDFVRDLDSPLARGRAGSVDRPGFVAIWLNSQPRRPFQAEILAPGVPQGSRRSNLVRAFTHITFTPLSTPPPFHPSHLLIRAPTTWYTFHSPTH